MPCTSVSDLSKLSNLDSQEILRQLKENFQNDEIYRLEKYSNGNKDPPHIYWTAEQSYQRLIQEHGNQCIIVTGDSGAGKTESTKQIIEFLVNRSPCTIQNLEETFKKVNPLIELFGNASTILNNNSSRFGKLIRLSYDNEQKLIGGDIRTFVLEKSRVTHHRANEKNFHIFYALFAGNLNQDLRELYSLEKPFEYRIMLGEEKPHLHRGIFQSNEEKHHNSQLYKQGINILQEIGFNETDITYILEILAACLHFGNIQFEQVDDQNDGVAIQNDDCLTTALNLMGMKEDEDVEDLRSELISRQIVVNGQSIRRPLNYIQACDVRDSVVKALYAGLFKAILDQINKSITGQTASCRSREQAIGILDISGFETLQHNSLEQLIINITNEQIHQYMLRVIFKAENRFYKQEGINLPPNTFTDNTHVLDLIFDSPGILSILDDQSKVANSDGRSLVDLYDNNLRQKVDVYLQCRQRMSFGIIHYAGQVTYNTTHFIIKNTGMIPALLKECVIENCENPFVAVYFDQPESVSCLRNPQRDTLSKKKARELAKVYQSGTKSTERSSQRQINTEVQQYKKSLTSLVDILEESKPLFVRCIKSNDNQQSRFFDEKVVLNQLQCAGLEDIARIRRDGFQIRLSFSNFFESCQVFRECAVVPECSSTAEAINNIMSYCKVDRSQYMVGSQTVFMKREAHDIVNKCRGELIKKQKQVEEEERRKREEERRKQEEEAEKVHIHPDDGARKQDEFATTDSSDHFNTSIDPLFVIDDAISQPRPTMSRDNVAADQVSVDSFPPNYRDVEDQNRRLEQKRWAWDSFRNTQRDYEGCVELERYFLKICRFVIYFGLFIGILTKGITTLLIPILFSSSLHPEEKHTNKSVVITELIICYSVPNVLSFIQSFFKICLGRVAKLEWKHFLPVFFLEGIEVCSTTYLLLKVFPYLSATSCITLVMMTLSVPTLLNIYKQISLSNLGRKFALRVILVFFAVVAFCIQCSALATLVIKPDIILSEPPTTDLRKYPNNYLTIMCLVGTSLGYCTNFLYGNFKIYKYKVNVKDWRIAVDKAGSKINILMCAIKIGLFLLMARLLEPDVTWTLSANTKQNDIRGISGFIEDHSFMFLYIYGAIFTAYEGTLACKLMMQRFAFFLPLVIVPLGCFGAVMGYCHQYPNKSDFYGLRLSCPDLDIDQMSWIGSSAGLLISIILLVLYVLFPENHRMDREERLFVLPTRNSFFSSIGLLVKRKDDAIEKKLKNHAKFKLQKDKNNDQTHDSTDEKRKTKTKARPYIYVCGTMWHETRQEMLQLLKSLFRLDFHRSTYRIAEKKFNANVDYFEQEIHIIFDDAFETDKKSKQRLPNQWVKQLVKCIDEAAMSIAKGHLEKWDNKPTKTSTPYGGRLTWIMPGGTEMTIHLKDKDKIRHRKRWSQIMYMYYLLGYKMMGAILEETLLEKETKKRYHYRRVTSILNHLPKDKVKKAHNSFILALDGDVDFKPEAVQKLIDKMTKNEKVGAVCGRIHPIGSGPVVWYQQFEYAIGHWLQKATEHVFGCVLCCPGAFSLFRATALMDDNVMKTYTSPPLEARHFIQYEQGEDRWLCTLMLQQGWKIDYAASADAFTYAPETFQEFFVQRRRWAPSTLANIIDLLASWRVTTKINDNISSLFVFYQFILLASSLLGIGTVTLMITGSFNAVLKISMVEAYVVALVPIVLYAIICMKCSNDIQITTAAVLTTVYTVVMVIVTVGLFVSLATEEPYSPNAVFFAEILFIFLCAGFAHPKEIMCLVHGLLYYLMVPSTFIFLTVYYMCNIHVVSWGTREKKSDETEDNSTDNKGDTIVKQEPILIRCLQKIGLMTLVKEIIRMVKSILGTRNETSENGNHIVETLPPMGISTPMSTARHRRLQRNPSTIINHDAWQAMEYLGIKPPEVVTKDEKDFWNDILEKYLHPLKEDKEKKKQIESELKSLRNNVAFGFLMMNFLFATAIFQLQNNEDQLKKMYILNEYEPLSVAFLLVFAIIIFVQFIGMMFHRYGTFLHLISSVHLFALSKAKEKEWTKMALKETETLQSANPEADDEVASVSCMSYDSRVHNELIDPDYPDDDILEDNQNNYNAYETNFRKRFHTIRQNMRLEARTNKYPTHENDKRGINRRELYMRTIGRNGGSRMNHGFVV